MFLLINQNIFSDLPDWNEIHKKTETCVLETIDSAYIYSIRIGGRSSEQDLSNLFVDIYFNTGVYELVSNFDDIIENNLLIKLHEVFNIEEIQVVTIYPFSIILKNEIKYGFGEKERIREEISRRTNAVVFINIIFDNSCYGFFQDKCYGYLSDYSNKRFNENNFNNFLEIFAEYFGIGNIVNF
jgi:hypothetical protein